MSVARFKPVSKADVAEILSVGCTKTIDHYIKEGLLPQPVKFSARDLWHPDDFYGFLSAILKRTALPGVGEATTAREARATEAQERVFKAVKRMPNRQPLSTLHHRPS
ncbi:hypothetical protein OOZ63_05815 [Paucibacter sp. PLA-PC-4]|uniref:helix-turn-helix transcriptional regulator n=1 Tax=Paucibacter sp. PLA-PC-4 TaxID=2993655 RepID=UPI0022490267|nr:hypothetical protein [Paucibacter sp. PLA-PC-4]MCX2861352.1 hypothetical protein [Paucibacter sp. PLA-PC-4]